MNIKNSIEVAVYNIKKLRAERSWSQTDLANKIGSDPSFVSRLEKPGDNLSLKVLDKIAEAFGVNAYELLQHNRIDEMGLREKLARVEELETLKKMMVEQMIDAFLREKGNR